MRKIHSRIGTHWSVAVLPKVSMWSFTQVDVVDELARLLGAAEEEVEVEQVLVGGHGLVDDAAHGRCARRERAQHLVAHVEPQRVDLEAQRRVLAVPDPVEVVVAEALLLVEEGGDRQAGRLLAVGPGAVVAVGQRLALGHDPAVGLRVDLRPAPPRAARGCRSCRSRARRRRRAGCRRGWRRPGTPCPRAPPRTPAAPARRGRAAPARPARATSCGSGRCPDPAAAKARTRASPSTATLPLRDAP